VREQQLQRISDRIANKAKVKRGLKCHVFDVDRVIFNGHLLTNFVFEVAHEFPDRHPIHDTLLGIRQRVVMGRLPLKTLNSLVLQYVENGFFVGLPYVKVAAIAERLATNLDVASSAFPLEIVSVLRALLDQEMDGVVVAITGAPEEIVVPFCRRFGFDGVISSVYVCDEDGLYTCDRDLEAAFRKGQVMDTLANAFGFCWGASLGMGDSVRDLGILNRVGYPFAINPEPALLDEVRTGGRIAYVEENEERGARIFKADGEGRLHEVSLQEVLPKDLCNFVAPIRGSLDNKTLATALL